MLINIEEAEKNDLLNALLEGNNFNRIIDCAARLLHNPVAVFDTSYHIIAHSRIYDVDDPTWREGIRQGYWDYEIIAKVRRRLTRQTSPDDPVVISGISPSRRRFSRLNLGDLHMGYFVVLEYNGLLEKIPDEIYRFTGSILAKELAAERPAIVHHRNQICEAILSDLLNAGFPNRLLFRERIITTPFDTKTTYQTILLDLNSYATSNQHGEVLKEKIAEYLPYSWSVINDSHLIVLIDRGHKCYENIGSLDDFAEFLKSMGIKAAISGEFSDLYLFPDQCAQTSHTLELAVLFGDSTQLAMNDDYKLLQLIEMIPREHVEEYCADVVLKVRNYDNKNRTDYLRTAFYYLHTRGSIQKTADILHVHRNTVTYRVERIKELFGMDFSDEYRNVQNYVSCIMLEYEKKTASST